MKLQKLTYFSYGWWLAYNDNTIINEEPQVWQHGPVFKSLYHALSGYGWRDITTIQNDNFTTVAPRVDPECQVQGLVTWVWNRYGAFDGDYLSDITHKRGTPWETTAADFSYRVPKNTPIPTSRIQAHFRELAVEYGFSEAG